MNIASKPLCKEVVDSEILPYGCIEVEHHTEVLDFLYFTTHHLFRKAILGDTILEARRPAPIPSRKSLRRIHDAKGRRQW